MIHTRLMNARLAAALRLFDTEQSPPDNRIAAVLEAVAQTRDGMFTGSELLDKIATALNCTFYELNEAGDEVRDGVPCTGALSRRSRR